MKNFLFALCCLLTALPCNADLFTSSDGALNLDMPAGWKRAKELPARGVLSLQKGTARLDLKTIDCTDEPCLEEMINNDVSAVKAKQMTVIKNTYTGEEVKRVELSTADPFYYISFYNPKSDFSAGYFLLDGQGYSVLAKNVTYAETDLIFGAIAPARAVPSLSTPAAEPTEETDEELLRAYDTQAIPDVDVEVLEDMPQTAVPTASASAAPAAKPAKRKTLVVAQMPPFIRALGRGYDVLMGLIALFLAAWLGAGLVRLWVRATRVETQANPNALYPIKIERRYGTPSLILRARDNQGNVLTALSVRWDALFMFFGIVIVLLSLILFAALSLCQQLSLLGVTMFAYNTAYSILSLVLPLGVVIFFCGMVWGQVAMSEITLFDRRGKKAAVILQKGYSLSHENYQIYFARSKELMLARRKRFALRRTWTLMNKDHIEFATLTERSAGRAVVRMVCGHLWGMLRADYDIRGAMDSRGALENTHGLFFRSVCNIDKPEAVAARDLLAMSLLISIRDRDKWYPWFN